MGPIGELYLACRGLSRRCSASSSPSIAVEHLRKAGSRKFDYKTGVNRGRSIIKVDYAATLNEKLPARTRLWENAVARCSAGEGSIPW